MSSWSCTALAVFLLVLAVPLGGCPKKIPPCTFCDGSHDAYPRAKFIVGTGRSADGYSEAEAAARAQVTRQIASEIEVLVHREAEVIQDGGRIRARSFVEQAIRERSSFEHAELIHIPPDGRWADKDYYWAFAILARRQADSALVVEQNEVEGRLVSLRDRAVAAGKSGDPGRFGQSSGPFFEVYDEWDVLRFQRRAIGGGEGGDTAAVDAMASDVAESQGALLDRIVWIVQVQAGDDVPGDAVDGVEQVLVKAISGLGVKTMLSQRDPCSESTGGRDLACGLVADVDVEQKLGQIGPKATIDVTLQGEACFGAGGALFTQSLPGNIGVHTSRKERALEIAVGKILGAEEAIVSELIGPISNECPLP